MLIKSQHDVHGIESELQLQCSYNILISSVLNINFTYWLHNKLEYSHATKDNKIVTETFEMINSKGC